jgi:hypothetical protein
MFAGEGCSEKLCDDTTHVKGQTRPLNLDSFDS